MENISLYFFSTLAQVWAALAVFGALALRDHVQKLETEMDRAALEMIPVARQIAPVLRKCFPTLDEAIFRDKHRFANFFIENKILEQNVWATFQKALGHGVSPFSPGGVNASLSTISDYLTGFIAYRNGQGYYRRLMKSYLLQSIGLLLLSTIAVSLAPHLETKCRFYTSVIALTALSLVPLNTLLLAFDIKLKSILKGL